MYINFAYPSQASRNSTGITAGTILILGINGVGYASGTTVASAYMGAAITPDTEQTALYNINEYFKNNVGITF